MKLALALLLVATTGALGADRLTFEHPERFRYDVTEQPDDMFRAALRLRAFDGEGISSLSFKIFVAKDEETRPKGQKEIDAAVQKMGASYVDGSVERTNRVVHLQPKNGSGAYCVFTDADLAGVAKLRPGQFRHITLGLVKANGYIFTVRGYSNMKEGTDFKAILNALESLRIDPQETTDRPRKEARRQPPPRA